MLVAEVFDKVAFCFELLPEETRGLGAVISSSGLPSGSSILQKVNIPKLPDGERPRRCGSALRTVSPKTGKKNWFTKTSVLLLFKRR